MNTSISPQEQELQAQIEAATESTVALQGKLLALDEQLKSSAAQRQQYQLLEQACTSLDQLSGLGAADLFWGSDQDAEKHLQRVRAVVAEFQAKIADFEQSRISLQDELNHELASVDKLSHDLKALHNHAFKPERKIGELPYRPAVMPWTKGVEDERRYKKILFILMFFGLTFGGMAPSLKKPISEDVAPLEMAPERIARFIQQNKQAKVEQKQAEQEAKKKEEQKKEEKAAEQIDKPKPEKAEEVVPPKETDKPVETEVQQARKSAETKGVLAFKDTFENILNDSSSMQMGADARISISANKATGDALQRSIIVSQATGGSGGINTSNLSRQGDGSGGRRIGSDSIKFSRIEGGTGLGGSSRKADRLSSKDLESTRGDEEIQIVFDRYKSAIYRIYNKQLRIDPSVRGRIVLQLVVEPDGSVSSCIVKSTELPDALAADIADRVLKFNFGVKEGVPAITLVYPIDLLPVN